jgi:hypothetical protein
MAGTACCKALLPVLLHAIACPDTLTGLYATRQNLLSASVSGRKKIPLYFSPSKTAAKKLAPCATLQACTRPVIFARSPNHFGSPADKVDKRW